MIDFREEVKEAINTLREHEFYTLDDFKETRIFGSKAAVLFKGARTPLDIELRLEPISEHKFAIVKNFTNSETGSEIKNFRAEIIIDPLQEDCAYIKELSLKIQGNRVFVSEEIPEDNPHQVPDSLVRLDLSPLSTEELL